MKQLLMAERFCLIAHVVSMAFGLAGLLLIVPNPELVMSLPPAGQTLFQWGMAGGGVVYIIFGAAAVAIYAYRTLGLGATLAFLVPSVFLSLSSELLGTSTGFPFGNYHYLSGLGYKIAGLVPFTIPLSWFYLGLVSYIIARAGVSAGKGQLNWVGQIGAIALGSLLLTAWDFVLDPAMSQTSVPFWEFEELGAFFGMPYRNLAGWMGTGALFMSVAAFLWRKTSIKLDRSEMGLPLIVYLVNFAFGAIITVTSLDSRFWFPTSLAVLLGVVPAIVLSWLAKPAANDLTEAIPSLESALKAEIPSQRVGALRK
ncbi:carotenoid biosynthesis protein [Tychonema sp. LEGE 07199]|uniref:gamma-carotene 1'-hydroxylase CruF n=1 Tax=unclassified Tychonema TaxID=2642144 RepID=UPI0018811307|nr:MULTISPECIES: carotenoid biosynthesis protein [unclassified Tychonema]MBE9124061.1 carotenoid biosynthesis protein [Tychonema sp. LEGE 07199]MBE9133882.1 carotenoid biosynthesis protein [Tychonema sp. LEGE 07196]